ncbi:MAG: 50S ribosome-binding GTPase, partial [candidate division Zixibacteria bacterium]|nr:50S ribosome-binding GTPase [candidate division Zixibacteria bacterium]
MNLPIVAIIGRPNVGKSTLFNRLLKRRMAVVDDKPGVTRDRNYASTTWNRKEFYLVDTGGFVPQSRTEMERLVKAQAEIAISEADMVLFLVDAKVGAQNID